METITIGGLTLDFYQSRHTTHEQLDLFRMTVMPGARMPVAHYHDSWDETVLGLAGRLDFRVDGESVAITPESSLFIPRGAVHGFDNTSDAPASCLCMLTPGALGPDYFRELAALVAEGPPDPERMKTIMSRYGLIPAPEGNRQH
ncbi:cupin domain-containing protein [Kushneria aurantia]|uniref:Cupin domain-containing protein n=1 Tax=Kushneria aurantia TaxID=504092 RepID=A0ABV6G7X0_9GAMM|nr:cupin domain-containing protein [Kushneria aurantia]